MISQLADTVLFTLIAFYGVFSFKTVLELCFTTYILKLIIALCDTPFLYLAKFNIGKNANTIDEKH